MDLRQIEYILRIADEKNISRAAEKLFISQPALNQQLINLEKELGTPLFERQRGELRLTEAGRVYVEAGRQILDIKKDAYARIEDVADVKNTELRIGVTPKSGARILGWVYKRFHAAHPDVRTAIEQMDTISLQKAVASGDLDLAIGTVGPEKDESRLFFEVLRTIEMMLVMSKDDPYLSEAYVDENGQRCIDLRKLRDESFALGPAAGTSRQMTDMLFEQAGFLPKIYHQGGAFPLRLSMVEMNQCCTFSEEHHSEVLPDTVERLRLSSHPKLESVVIYKKSRHLTMTERDFISIASLFWENNR